jgi:type II secretory pathway component PulF
MRNKRLALLLVSVLAVLGLMIVLVPGFPPAEGAAAWKVSFYDFFVSVRDVAVGDFYFFLVCAAALFISAYMLIVKPLKAIKGKNKQVSMVRKGLFAIIATYIILLIAVPFFTLATGAGTALTAFYDHFVAVKDVIVADWSFLVGFGFILFAIYWLLTRKK